MAEPDRQILIVFALMERNRQQGRNLRLSNRELGVLASVFGPMMSAALAWGARAEEASSPLPDVRAHLVRAAAVLDGGDDVAAAAALEAAAEAAAKDAVWCSSDERAITQVQRASTYRHLAAVLRQSSFGGPR